MWNVLPSVQASEALRANLAQPADQADPSPSNRFGSPERSPSEYLIAAGGNVSEAAAAAGLSKAEFLQDLGLDASLPQVSNAAHFLVLMGALSLTQLAQDHLQHLFFEAATAEDTTSPSSPFPRVIDPTNPSSGSDLEALAQNVPSKVSFKEATLLWKHAADFVSAAMAQANPAARPSRFTPPSDRSRIIQASRGLPTADHPDPDQQLHNPSGFAEDAELDALRQKLRESPPHIRDMLARALGSDPDPGEAE